MLRRGVRRNKKAGRGAGLICCVVVGSWLHVGCDIPSCCGDVTAPNLMLLPLPLGMLCSGLRHGGGRGEDRGETGAYHPGKTHAGENMCLEAFSFISLTGACNIARYHYKDFLGCVLEGWVLSLFLQLAGCSTASLGGGYWYK